MPSAISNINNCRTCLLSRCHSACNSEKIGNNSISASQVVGNPTGSKQSGKATVVRYFASAGVIACLPRISGSEVINPGSENRRVAAEKTRVLRMGFVAKTATPNPAPAHMPTAE